MINQKTTLNLIFLLSCIAAAARGEGWNCTSNGMLVYTSDPKNLECDTPYKCFQTYRSGKGETLELAQADAQRACERAGRELGVYIRNCDVVTCSHLMSRPSHSHERFGVEVRQSSSWGSPVSSLKDVADGVCQGLPSGRYAFSVGASRISRNFGVITAIADFECR